MSARGTDRGVTGGLRLRIRPAQLVILLGIVLIIGLPLFAGSERRAAVAEYVRSSNIGSGTPYVFKSPGVLNTHVPPPTGGIDADQIPLTLGARLEALLARPALDQWEAELPNRQQCPMFTFTRNTYFFHDGKPDMWQRISADDVRRYRQKMIDYFRKLDREGVRMVWDDSMAEGLPMAQRRGLIYTGGEGKTIKRLRQSLHMLRNVIKSDIPVEIYHYPGEMEDTTVRTEFTEKWKVELIESKAKKTDGKAWQIKNRAFLDTKFTQFVYMDSDNIPLSDPMDLFDGVEFKQGGSVFWPDLYKDHPDNAIWRVLGRQCSDDHWPAESGQVIFDKSANNGLNLAVLHLSNHMMEESKSYDFLGYGDKDTYRYAFYALGLDYQQCPRMFASVGGYQRMDGTADDSYFCGHSMLHWGLTPPSALRDPTFRPKPAFLHLILGKHRYGMIAERIWSHAKRPREDYINDPRLVRTLYEFTGDCFAITLKGPDGLPNAPNSYGDGQGTLIEPMGDILDPHIWKALSGMAQEFVDMNPPGS